MRRLVLTSAAEIEQRSTTTPADLTPDEKRIRETPPHRRYRGRNRRRQDPPRIDAAAEWLADDLTRHPGAPCADVADSALAVGHDYDALTRASRRLGVITVSKDGPFGSSLTYWSLPQ